MDSTLIALVHCFETRCEKTQANGRQRKQIVKRFVEDTLGNGFRVVGI